MKTFQRSYEILSGVPSAEQDAPVQAALGYMLLTAGRSVLAVQRFERAVNNDPGNPEYYLDLGVAQDVAGDPDSAIKSFRNSIAADPYDYRAYRALADLYQHRQQPAQSRAVIDDFLKLMPQSIVMRLNP